MWGIFLVAQRFFCLQKKKKYDLQKMRQIISHISKEGPIPSRKRNAKLIRYSHLTVRVRHPQASGKIVEVANLLVLKTVRRRGQ